MRSLPTFPVPEPGVKPAVKPATSVPAAWYCTVKCRSPDAASLPGEPFRL
jgi:hypothetical protein